MTTPALDRYAVFGNPVGHSKSPAIHAAFARQTGQPIRYEAILAPLDGFSSALRDFIAAGGRGANVTVPFKEEAWRLATRLSPRAERAGAVNTLSLDGSADIVGDNTDGIGLLRDIESNLGIRLAGKAILVVGAGGAARGVLAPLLAAGPARLHVANRTADKAHELARRFSDLGPIFAGGLPDLAGQQFDLVINATSASLGGQLPELPSGVFAPASTAYDMMYGRTETPFLELARRSGATCLADGLGMLVEQAAEAFFLWRGTRPATGTVLGELRAALRG